MQIKILTGRVSRQRLLCMGLSPILRPVPQHGIESDRDAERDLFALLLCSSALRRLQQQKEARGKGHQLPDPAQINGLTGGSNSAYAAVQMTRIRTKRHFVIFASVVWLAQASNGVSASRKSTDR